ncbi:MAG: ATP-dependent zinc metalloprotease FtsH [Sandaracinaceae bacterium]|nr:ATP-dependent zinc metalloprotease FtsH [Sandaracinaceae bacterium]
MSALAAETATPASSRVRYDELQTWIDEDRVESVVLGEREIRGSFKEGHVPERDGVTSTQRRFVVGRVEDPALVERLTAHQVRFEGETVSSWSEAWPTLVSVGLTVIMVFFLWRMLAQRGGATGALAFGKSRGKVLQEADVDVTFDDVAGAEEAKEELLEVIELLRKPEKFTRIGAKIPKGVLLVGPPGTGKTLLARAVAGEAGVPFISINGSEFVEMFVGVGAARVRDLFEQAERAAPCIVFIDELDALGRSRSGGGGFAGNEERESTLNQLLVEMDGFAPHRAVILMAATNRPEVLDPALLRAGRFDRQILVDRPDRVGREAILRVHSRNVRLSDDIDLEVIARRTPGFAGADLANLINEAALLAAREDAEAVTMEHVSAALDRVVAGLAKKNRLLDPAERERVAYHEVGHALCSHLAHSGERVHKISIVPRGLGALGFTMNLPDRETQMMTRPELVARLRGLLGGRAAEEVIYGEPSTGAQNDLQKATQIARAMITEYGMSEELGPVYLGGDPRPMFLGGPPVPSGAGAHGALVADRVDAEVRGLVAGALADARALLEGHRAHLEKMTRRLLEAEQLEGDELAALLAAAEGPAGEALAPLSEGSRS